MKQISTKRREKLDQEHGINRKDLQDSFKGLDEVYRVSEKEEIKKYLEIGKTPEQYYKDQQAT